MADIDFTPKNYVQGSNVPPWNAAAANAIEAAIEKIVHKALRGAEILVANDSDMVSGAGIGVANAVAYVDFNTLVKGGKYVVYGTNAPGGYTGYTFYVEVIGQNNGYCWQRAFLIESALIGSVYERFYNGSWVAWELQTNRSNGGQPPMPKPTSNASTKDGMTIGQVWVEDLAGVAALLAPNCGGTVELIITTYGETQKMALVAGNGGNIGNTSGNCRAVWRKTSN